MKKFTMSSIKFLRLITGEDIISELTISENSEGDIINLINPMKIVYMTSPATGQLSMFLMKWVFPNICKEETYTIYSSDILTTGNPTTDMIGYYYKTISKYDGTYSEIEDELDFLAKGNTNPDDDPEPDESNNTGSGGETKKKTGVVKQKQSTPSPNKKQSKQNKKDEPDLSKYSESEKIEIIKALLEKREPDKSVH